jgi:hypothetical protein
VTARDEHQQIGDGFVNRAFVSTSKFTQKKGVSK